MLHDAVESFLVLACEHFNVEPHQQFEKQWGVLAPKLPGDGLAVQQGMRRLNKIRVALKHHGAHPSIGSIEQAIADTSTFMAANTRLVFGMDYEAVSMVDVISEPMARRLAEIGQEAAMLGDYILAMMRIREAFDHLFTDHDVIKWDRFGSGTVFSFGPPLGSHRLNEDKIAKILSVGGDNMRYSHDYRRLGEHISRLMTIADKTQAGMRITALGIDYPSYLRFINLTPAYDDMANGTRSWRSQVGYAPDAETWSFALQFVVTASLRIAAAEAHIADSGWVTRDPWGQVQWEQLTTEPSDHDGLQ